MKEIPVRDLDLEVRLVALAGIRAYGFLNEQRNALGVGAEAVRQDLERAIRTQYVPEHRHRNNPPHKLGSSDSHSAV